MWSETKPIFPLTRMRVLPILKYFMAYSILPHFSNRQRSMLFFTFLFKLFLIEHKTQPKKTKTKQTNKIHQQEFKLPGGDINHEPSIHLK